MAKRKQARPSRPGGSTALTNDHVLDGHVENEGEGELAADAEEIPGVLNEAEQATGGNSCKKRRFKNILGTNLFTRDFHVFRELQLQCNVLGD